MYVYRLTRLLAALLLLLGGLTISSPAGASITAQGETVVVEAADGDVFQPATVTINVGDTVTWRNTDNVPHTSTSDDDVWDSGNLNQGEEFSFTYEEAGTYGYFCAYHPGMEGTVVVQEAAQQEDTTEEEKPAATAVPEETTEGDQQGDAQDDQQAGAGDDQQGHVEMPDTGAGGTAGGGIGTVLVVLLAGVLLLAVGGLRARIARSR